MESKIGELLTESVTENEEMLTGWLTKEPTAEQEVE